MPFFTPNQDDPTPTPRPKDAGMVVIDPVDGLSIDGDRFPWNLVAVDIQNASTRPVLILTMHCDDLEIRPRKKDQP